MELHPHPDSPVSPVARIRAFPCRLGQGRLKLVFDVQGDMEFLKLPEEKSKGRRDGLWKHSCLEAFVAPASGSTYLELNLAPGGNWAAYRFSGYRAGMAGIDIPAPSISWETGTDRLGLVAELDLGKLDGLDPGLDWKLGLSAVIEAQDGSLSHWALAHPQGRADFHHPDCFVLRLPPADEA